MFLWHYNSPSTDEHADRLGRGLHGCGNAHDDSTDEDGRTTAKPVCQVWGHGVGCKRADILRLISFCGEQGADTAYLNGIEEPKLGTVRVSEIVVPLVERLQTIHHASIVPVCGRRDEPTRNLSENNKIIWRGATHRSKIQKLR